ncbi:MAG: hypothetical protein ACXW1N_07710 [Halobacteriota archaeon]
MKEVKEPCIYKASAKVMADIFISYAREDRAVAAMLAGALARSPGVDDMMLPAEPEERVRTGCQVEVVGWWQMRRAKVRPSSRAAHANVSAFFGPWKDTLRRT